MFCHFCPVIYSEMAKHDPFLIFNLLKKVIFCAKNKKKKQA